MKVDDLEIAKSVFNPKRLKILKLVEKEAMTVKEISEGLNEHPSRLYYHIHKLVDQGLIEVTETRQVGHLTESYYQTKQDLGAFNIDERFAQENQVFIVQQLLKQVNRTIDIMKTDLDRAATKKDYQSSASLLSAELTHQEWHELNAEIRKLIHSKTKESNEKANKSEEKQTINFILMSYIDDEEE
jgi:DNA-binding transcriptional ArsR family regulator